MDDPLVWYDEIETLAALNRKWFIADRQGSVIADDDGDRDRFLRRLPAAWAAD